MIYHPTLPPPPQILSIPSTRHRRNLQLNFLHKRKRPIPQDTHILQKLPLKIDPRLSCICNRAITIRDMNIGLRRIHTNGHFRNIR